MGKYTPIENFLRNRKSLEKEIQLSFSQIEGIIQDNLPPAARKFRPWWGNEKEGAHVQAKAWMNAGWEVDSVDLSRELVTFIRILQPKTKSKFGPSIPLPYMRRIPICVDSEYIY